MAITREFVQAVRSRIAETPEITTAQLAADLHVPESHVIMAFPVAMRMRCKAEELTQILGVLSLWDGLSVTPLPRSLTAQPVQHAQSYAHGQSETAPLPTLADATAALYLEDVAVIWLVSRPAGTEAGFSVRFFTAEGGHILSIYLEGSNPTGLQANTRYDALCSQFGVTPKPRRHCHGCGNCSCGKAKKNNAAAA